MLGAIVSIILTLIVVGVLWWAIEQLLPLIPMNETIRKVVYVLLILLLVFIVLWVVVTLISMLAGVNVPFYGAGYHALR